MMNGDYGMSGGMLFFGLLWLIIGLLVITVLILMILALLQYLKKGSEVADRKTLDNTGENRR